MVGAGAALEDESPVALGRSVEAEAVAGAERHRVDGEAMALADVGIGAGQRVAGAAEEDHLLEIVDVRIEPEAAHVAADDQLVLVAAAEAERVDAAGQDRMGGRVVEEARAAS